MEQIFKKNKAANRNPSFPQHFALISFSTEECTFRAAVVWVPHSRASQSYGKKNRKRRDEHHLVFVESKLCLLSKHCEIADNEGLRKVP